MSKNKVYSILFVSRNKDNKHLDGFRERTKVFLTDKKPLELNDKFNKFTREGVHGELSRFYMSVNARDEIKVKQKLIAFLVENLEYPLWKLDTKLVSIARQPGCATEKKWLFDFDSKDEDLLRSFLAELKSHTIVEMVRNTPNGYAIIVKHGFDTRELLEKYKDVELKRDGELLIDYKYKG